MRTRTKHEKARDEALGREGERWVKRILVEAGYKVKDFTDWYDPDGRLMSVVDLKKWEQVFPDFKVDGNHVDAKYRRNGRLRLESLSKQLAFYPKTRYIIVSDTTKVLFKAVPHAYILEHRPILRGIPIEKIWCRVSTQLRERLEEEIRDIKPFEAIREKYAQTGEP